MVKRREQFRVCAINRRGPPQCPPDHSYPDGKDVGAAMPGAATCKAMLPYPAPRTPRLGRGMPPLRIHGRRHRRRSP